MESSFPLGSNYGKLSYLAELVKASILASDYVMTAMFGFRLEYPPWRMFTTDNQQKAQGSVPAVWSLCRRLSFDP